MLQLSSSRRGSLLKLASSTREWPLKIPQTISATLQLAHIALLSDRLDDAQRWLKKAITLQPGDDAKVMLAEVFYRRDDFQKAAATLNGIAVPFWIAGEHFMVGWGHVETIPPTLLFVDTGLAGAEVKLAESVIKAAGIKLEENKAYEGAGGGGKLKIVPYTVRQLSFGDVKQENVAGLYDGPFPWENTFGFHLAGMVGQDSPSPMR